MLDSRSWSATSTLHFNEQLSDAGTMDLHPTWVDVFRNLGVNIVNLADFHSDSHPKDSGPIRFQSKRSISKAAAVFPIATFC